ncbi:MAG: glycosyltransferase N-terminal domain-containing protein [Bacteroidales bacterium]|nr:glycosyltransferase N-terminal domain-containing protein [Bacteroidales bacterium]
MRLLYTTAIYVYTFFIRCAAGVGVSKAKKWVAGRRRWHDKLPINPDNRKTAWFHCASLGEFEQGRPVMEAFKEKHPGYRIVLTFFSPSGYEVRKEYSGADVVAYLPPDTPRNANRFIRQIQPDIAFFVKYEFWFNYLHALKSHNTPVYLVSGVFRKQQHFFRWYGGWFRKQLEAFDKFFVQNTVSRNLIEEIYPGKALITGDTRFDRVYAIARQAEPFPAVEAFKDERMLFIAGSTWPAAASGDPPVFAEARKSREYQAGDSATRGRRTTHTNIDAKAARGGCPLF